MVPTKVMRLAVLAVLAACQSKDSPPPAPAPVKQETICAIGSRVLDKASCAAADKDLAMSRKAYQGIVQTGSKLDARQLDAMCAQMIRALQTDMQKAGCTIDLPPDDQRRMDTFLTEWFAQRAPVTPTGDAASDA